jgi:hypothetical protein
MAKQLIIQPLTIKSDSQKKCQKSNLVHHEQ